MRARRTTLPTQHTRMLLDRVPQTHTHTHTLRQTTTTHVNQTLHTPRYIITRVHAYSPTHNFPPTQKCVISTHTCMSFGAMHASNHLGVFVLSGRHDGVNSVYYGNNKIVHASCLCDVTKTVSMHKFLACCGSRVLPRPNRNKTWFLLCKRWCYRVPA